MSKLQHALYRSDQIRWCEQQAVQSYQLSEHELMLRAGTAAFLLMRRLYPKFRHIAVFCGAGNNAGDGYVLARLAHEQGLTVSVYQCNAGDDLPFAAMHAALEASAAGLEYQSADEPLDSEVELIVDALLGIGLKGPVYGIIASAIHQINASALPVISLDIPSGLNADTGQVEAIAVKASATLSFIAPKLGLYTLDAADYCGDIYCSSLQLEPCLTQLSPAAVLLDEADLALPLAPRKKNSHKGDYGHVLVIGGGAGMPGAAALTAKAAMRSGAGAVSVATLADYAHSFLSLVPEAMIFGVDSAEDLAPLLAKATVCVIGPGLGEDSWAQQLF